MVNKYKNELHKLTNEFDFSSKNPFEVAKYISLITNFIGKEYIQGYTMNLPTSNLVLTRARKHKKERRLFKNIKELWYPETKYIVNPGRTNFQHKQIYYCSDVAGTSLFEVKPENVGDWITILDVSIEKDNLNLLSFGLSAKYPSTPSCSFSDKDIALNQFITEKFKEKIPDDKPYLYLPTAIITNLVMPDPNYDGIIFPSVASQLKGENIALKINTIDNFYTLKEVRVFEVSSFKSNSDFKVECKFISKEIKKNGEIDWKKITCNGHNINENIYHK